MSQEISFLDELNPTQRQAVMYSDGPSLVIAGAGSGKTRVLTYKIAYLMQMGIPAYSILALTFTNKASREMKERIAQLVGEKEARYLWMGTFHSVCTRILRAEAKHLGYDGALSVYDTADSKSLLKSIVKTMGLDEKKYKVNNVYGRISAAKNNLMSPIAYAQSADIRKSDSQVGMHRMPEIYEEYTKRCRMANAMDFDDLLYYTNVLFREFPDILRKYQERYSYILVDEYQDTNFSQYLIVKKLAEAHQRVCVVGDDAQSIYSFRGANIENILTFQQAYPQAQLFKLERNYRSTQNIVDAANSLIANNKGQIPKKVYSEKETGELIHVHQAYNDMEEGALVAKEIVQLRRFEKENFNDIAVLYRTNAQSRVLEESLRKSGIPYRIYGGHSFYQRKEIKDALAYLRLVNNPLDEESFKRIINVPKRGIGDTTVDKMLGCAHTQGISVWKVLENPLAVNLDVNGGTLKKLGVFRDMLQVFIDLRENTDAYELATQIIKGSGLLTDALADKNPDGIDRHQNIQELLNGIHEFVEQQYNNGATEAPLAEFLSEVSLLTDQDEDEETDAPKVTLMTIHAAKGLEYNTVFLVGLEENLFPSQFVENERDLEEERRLFYVAITRAKKCCHISYAKNRFRHGSVSFSNPSRFLNDIDDQYLDSTPHKNRATERLFDFDKERDLFTKPQSTAYTDAPVLSKPKPEASVSKVGKTYLKNADKKAWTDAPYTEGMLVQHAVFGIGKVVSCYQENGSEKVEVNFGEKTTKTLLVKFAKLEILV